MSMLPYQVRVIAERAELEHKCTGLKAFIASSKFDAVEKDEATRLALQLRYMLLYLDILDQRIAAFANTQE